MWKDMSKYAETEGWVVLDVLWSLPTELYCSGNIERRTYQSLKLLYRIPDPVSKRDHQIPEQVRRPCPRRENHHHHHSCRKNDHDICLSRGVYRLPVESKPQIAKH